MSFIIKMLTVECQDCGYTEEVDDSDQRFDELVEFEKEDCPACENRILEAI